MKQKKCRHCKHLFTPRNSLQVACSPDCAIALARQQKVKEERKALRARKQALKTKGEHLKELQAVFNQYIRLRDRDLPCISCGRYHQGQWHAGHYRTVGANPELRFEELNVWRQCAPCNNHLSGNLINYRINLVKRIGQKKVDWLEGPHDPLKLSINDIKDLKSHYRAKCRELEKQAA